MKPRHLLPAERASYTHIDPARLDSVRVVRIPALPGRYQGITLGSLIIVAVDVPRDGSSGLLAHELVHVQQWHDQGAVGFLSHYIADFTRNLRRQRSWSRAYRAITAEQLARLGATQWNDERYRRQNPRLP